MKRNKVIAKVEMKLIKSKTSAQKDFGAKDLEKQMLLVAQGKHSNSVVNKDLKGIYGIVAEHVDGNRGAFSDVMQIALFMYIIMNWTWTHSDLASGSLRPREAPRSPCPNSQASRRGSRHLWADRRGLPAPASPDLPPSGP